MFLKSMENTVTGLNRGGERVTCQAEHTCGGEHVRMRHVQKCQDGTRGGEVIRGRSHVGCDEAGMRDGFAPSRLTLRGG